MRYITNAKLIDKLGIRCIFCGQLAFQEYRDHEPTDMCSCEGAKLYSEILEKEEQLRTFETIGRYVLEKFVLEQKLEDAEALLRKHGRL